MYVWSAAKLISRAVAQAATVDTAGSTKFFFQATGTLSFIVSGLEIDRSGSVTSRTEQVLGIGYNDPSLPKIYPHPYGHSTGSPAMQFTFALAEPDGSNLLFSVNERSTFSYDEEDGSPYLYSSSALNSRFFTAYRLGDAIPGASGLVPYADYAFTIAGNSNSATDEEIWEDESTISNIVSTSKFLDQSALTFDGGALLLSYRLDLKADGTITTELWPDPPVEHPYHTESSQISYQFVDMEAPGMPVPVVLDTTPVGTSVVVDRPADQLGVIWIDSSSNTGFRLSMASVDATGALVRSFKADIVASDIEGAPTLGAMTVLDANAAADGSTVVLIESKGRPYLAQFDRGLHLQGEITAITGGRWGGPSPEHVSQTAIVRLADGGFVLGLSLEADLAAGGAGHRLLIQQYGADSVEIGRPVKVAADSGWFNLADLGNGLLNLAWTDGGSTYSEVLDARMAGFTEVGTDGPDLLLGTAFADTLYGRLGNDRLFGAGGHDRLYGEAGNDLLVGAEGNSRLDGGAGSDRARYDAASVVDLLDKTLNSGLALGDVLVSIENLRGSSEADSFHGSDTANMLEGKGGDDTLVGRGGDDVLVGGKGLDLLQGGPGADQFRFRGPSEGRDTIVDFVSGQDVIAIGGTGFGIDTISLVSDADPVPPTPSPVFLFERDTSLLSFDADGSGAGEAVEIAMLLGVTQLGIGDFLLI